jgi:cell division protein FtsI (penicillin-binding protein 3)
LTVDKHIINCVIHHPYINGHGAVNIANILKLSCNVGAARVALKIGEERLSTYLRRFGFGSRTGVELPGESPGILPAASPWRDITLANVAFGQGVAVTALQLASAYAAIANDGVFVAPTVLKRENGRPKASHRVVSEQTAKLLRKYLQGVVEGGTGKAAKIRWYKVAGKTGTAQKAEPGRGYIPGKYVALMVGFVPVDRPRVAVLAAIDEPSGSHYGGVVAAPVFREVARAAMVRLNVPPDDWSDTFDGSVPSTWPKSH